MRHDQACARGACSTLRWTRRSSRAVLRGRATSAAGIDPEQVRGLRIALRAVDVRRRGKGRCLRFIVHADLVVDSTFHGVVFDGAVRAGKFVEVPKVGTCRVIERALSTIRGASCASSVRVPATLVAS